MASASTGIRAPGVGPRRVGTPDTDRRLGYLLVLPTIAILLAITLFPFASNVWNSFHHVNLLEPGARPFVGLENYGQLASDPAFRATFLRTTVYTVVSVAIELTVGLALALVIHREFRGRGLVRAAILIPWAVPTVVSAMLWKTMFDPHNGFVNYLLGVFHLPGATTTWLAGKWTAWAAILVADAWKNTPFMAILLLAGLQVIPGDVYEAARVDGATGWQAFRRITLPLLKPALLVALIFRTLSAFLIFDVIYIMTGGGPGNSTETLSYVNWRAFLVNTDFGYGGAVSVTLVAMALILAGVYIKALKPET
jgi:multiple sugar transport system permease protein